MPHRRQGRPEVGHLISDHVTVQAEEAAMTWDELLAHCLAKPGAWQDEPW